MSEELKYGTRLKFSLYGVDLEVFSPSAEAAVSEFKKALEATKTAKAARQDTSHRDED